MLENEQFFPKRVLESSLLGANGQVLLGFMDGSIDTIAALSTPAGTSALAMVRASGPGCAALAAEIFGCGLSPRLARHGDYRGVDGQLIDDVVGLFFAGPKSYTGEDTLEISAHGNPLIAQRILEDLFSRGCRTAEPGEFTRRAFSNGRLDLSQAEAVADLIEARSERALAAANQQLRGSLGRLLAQMTEDLLAALARIEAYIDFPDEDLPAEDRREVIAAVRGAWQQTQRLLATQHYGTILRDGIKTVIVGAPNAGKSSLLNRLVGHERALVSAEPGTTRDFIEERMMLGGHCIRLVDTAGLNRNPGALEKLGMEKTLERAAEADLFLWVVDARSGEARWPEELASLFDAKKTILILNKIDLLEHPSSGAAGSAGAVPHPAGVTIAPVSALTGQGLEKLIEAVVDRAESFRTETGEDVIAINARHADALRRAQTSFSAALSRLESTAETELIASDLRAGLDALGEIAGRIDNERMLDHLFATFCIGK